MATGERAEPILDYVITVHAALEMKRRGLNEETVRSVLAVPEQRLEVRPGRMVLQSRISLGAPARDFLVRVFVDVNRRPAEVVTVYRTTKIGKYWRQP
jgi:hypothetical protein